MDGFETFLRNVCLGAVVCCVPVIFVAFLLVRRIGFTAIITVLPILTGFFNLFGGAMGGLFGRGRKDDDDDLGTAVGSVRRKLSTDQLRLKAQSLDFGDALAREQANFNAQAAPGIPQPGPSLPPATPAQSGFPPQTSYTPGYPRQSGYPAAPPGSPQPGTPQSGTIPGAPLTPSPLGRDLYGTPGSPASPPQPTAPIPGVPQYPVNPPPSSAGYPPAGTPGYTPPPAVNLPPASYPPAGTPPPSALPPVGLPPAQNVPPGGAPPGTPDLLGPYSPPDLRSQIRRPRAGSRSTRDSNRSDDEIFGGLLDVDGDGIPET